MATPGERCCIPWRERELPDDVVKKIQARLPLASLFRSRSVCKAWSRSVKSACFLRERAQAGGGGPELLLYLADRTSATSCAYDPASGRWYRLDLPGPWLQPGGGGAVEEEEEEEEELEDEHRWCLQTAVAVPPRPAAYGSYSTAVMEVGRRMVVGSPVQGRWTHLPPAFPSMSLRMRHVRGLFVDRDGDGFKVVAVAAEQGQSRGELAVPTLVFDSRTWKWSLSRPVITGEEGESSSSPWWSWSGPGAFVGRVLYCLTCRCNLLAYDLDKAAWSWTEVANPASSRGALLAARVVAVDDEHLVCVGVVQEATHWRLHLWRMDWASRRWVRLETMPAAMFDGFLGRASGRRVAMQYLRLGVASIRHRVYVMSRDVPGGLGVECDLQNALTATAAVSYNNDQPEAPPGPSSSSSSSPSTCCWRWLPCCPFYDRERSINCKEGGGYQLTRDATQHCWDMDHQRWLHRLKSSSPALAVAVAIAPAKSTSVITA